MQTKHRHIDLIALTSSIICAVHCAVVPLVIATASLSGLHFIENSYIEWFFIGLGLLFIAISLYPSYKKIHQSFKPLCFASLGFLILAMSRLDFTEIWEISTTVSGALLIAIAHYLNWKLLKKEVNIQHKSSF